MKIAIDIAEAKTCPFCGDKRQSLYETVGYTQIVCDRCGAEGPAEETVAKALTAWNRRREAAHV